LEDSDLPTVLVEASLIAEKTERVFGGLSGEQVNWKPGAGEWSIGQCFDHLVISNRPYVQIFEEILAGQRRSRIWERMPLLPHLFGRLLITTLRPDSERRVKARPAFYPSTVAQSHERKPQPRPRCDHDHVAGGPLRHVQPDGCLPHHRRSRAESLCPGDASQG